MKHKWLIVQNVGLWQALGLIELKLYFILF